MIDHILGYRTEADAKNDSAVAKYCPKGVWNLSVCQPNVLLWNPADDVQHPGPPPYTTHTPYDGNWRVLIGLPSIDMALNNSKGMEIIWNRDTGNVINTLWNAADLAVIHYQPMFVGSHYPFMSS